MEYDVETHPHSGQNDGIPDHISSEVSQILDAIRRTVLSNPEEARTAVLRLETLLAPPVKGETPNVRGGLAPWQKRKIERYVREHVDGSLPVDELAGQLSLSASHFTRAFRETFAEPPHTYIVRSRLELAQQLMLSTGEALSQIALACGFADQSHFSKAFRRVVGESPNGWRRRNLTEAQAQVIGRIAIGAR
jgi:AraC family transcriptional regulator